MPILGKAINNHKDGSLTMGGREAVNKVHGDIRPNMLGHGQGLQQPCRLGVGCFKALVGVTVPNKTTKLFHAGPIKYSLNAPKTLLKSFMGAVMEFGDDCCCEGRFRFEVDPILEINEASV